MDIKEVKRDLGKDWSGYQEVLVSALTNRNAFVSKINKYLIDNAGKQHTDNAQRQIQPADVDIFVHTMYSLKKGQPMGCPPYFS